MPIDVLQLNQKLEEVQQASDLTAIEETRMQVRQLLEAENPAECMEAFREVYEQVTDAGSSEMDESLVVREALLFVVSAVAKESSEFSLDNLNFQFVHRAEGIPFLKGISDLGKSTDWSVEELSENQAADIQTHFRAIAANITRRTGDQSSDADVQRKLYAEAQREFETVQEYYSQKNDHKKLSLIEYELGHIAYLLDDFEHSVMWFRRSAESAEKDSDTIGALIGKCKALVSEFDGKLQEPAVLVEPMEIIRGKFEENVTPENNRVIAWNTNATNHLRLIAEAAEDWPTVLRTIELLCNDQRILANLKQSWAQVVLTECSANLEQIHSAGSASEQEQVSALRSEVQKLIENEQK